MFDFGAAIAHSKKSLSATCVEAILMAPSGGGKSSVTGSLAAFGPVLYLYTTGEDHGPVAARTHAVRLGLDPDLIQGVCLDYGVDAKGLERKFESDEVIQRAVGFLRNVDGIKAAGFKSVVVDGASELEIFIRSSNAFKEGCKTDKGKHNNFAEPVATTALFRDVINALKDLQRLLGVHFVITSMLDVKEFGSMGDIVEASPRLRGYSVAEMLLQQFGDVLVVGPMTKGSETRYRFQFMTDVVKTSKDEAGMTKRAFNFKPRVKGCATLPNSVDADLREILALKK